LRNQEIVVDARHPVKSFGLRSYNDSTSSFESDKLCVTALAVTIGKTLVGMAVVYRTESIRWLRQWNQVKRPSLFSDPIG